MTDRYDVVCCSLEPWDEVWRRNQLLVTELLQLRPGLRVLFAELPVDVAWMLAHRRWPGRLPLRRIGDSGRLWAFAPRKWVPRRIWPGVDQRLEDRVLSQARKLGLERPVLWINDCAYADLVAKTGWPTVYDITDDWLLAHGRPHELRRRRRNDQKLIDEADEVVVCSPALAETRGRHRPVHLIANGVDVDHFRHQRPRPSDLPDGRILMYSGTLAEGRIDVGLCVDLARALDGRATLVLVGPNSLVDTSSQRLKESGAVLLGPRSYDTIPAYLQHADVLVVPHVLSPFTESLDPIKARELVALARPTVSTPVAGFRDLGPPITVAAPGDFTQTVLGLLDQPPVPPGPGVLAEAPPSWTDRAKEFLAVLDRAADSRGTATSG